MSKQLRRTVVGLLALFPALWGESAANLTGNWYLNVEKSKWGRHRKPVSVAVRVEHNEPSLKYTGTVVDANGESRAIAFDQMIDGKEYPAETGLGPGKIVVSRVDANTLSVVIRSDDGRLEQTIRTTLSKDGTTLTRRLTLRSPEGRESWTEVYERK